MLNGISYLTVRVEEVSELACPNRAGLNTGRIPSLSCPLDAEGAFFNNTPVTRPIPKVMGLGVYLLGWPFGSPQLNLLAP